MLGVLLVAGGALAAVLWHTRSTATTPVVVAARPIARGSAISADDLAVGHAAGEGVVLMGGERAGDLVGRVAVIDVGAGEPLTAAAVADVAPLGVDEALSAVAIEPGWAPADLAPGDPVRVVTVRPVSATVDETATLFPAPVTVWDVTSPSDGTTTTVVTLRGPLELATELALASSVQIARVGG